MNLKSHRLAWSLMGIVAVGCGGSSAKSPEAGAGVDASPDGTADATQPTVDASADANLPLTGAGSHVLVPTPPSAPITLVGSGPDTCTNQIPAPGDRWCAFTKPGSTLGFNELWVIDVTKAAAGVAITCDTTDANCLRLTNGLFQDPMAGFSMDGFEGDTLIYYAELGPTATATTGFIGPVYGWRPGWSGGRALTGTAGVVCSGQAVSDTALCFENRDDSVTTQVSYELHAGTLPGDGAAGLPKVDNVLISLSSDDMNVRKFQADLSADGTYVAWSARPTATGVETLNLQKVGDTSTRVTVAQDVTRWAISGDGTQWYWLSKFNYDVNGNESGTLQAAAFPSGTGATATTLASAVSDFVPAGQRGLVFRSGETQGLANLTFMADTNAATALKALDTGVLAVVDQSTDGNETVYVKNVSAAGTLTDLFIASSTGGAPCALATQTVAAPTASFISGGAIAAWASVDELTNNIAGQYTTVSNCTTRVFAQNVAQWIPASDQGYVYLDQVVVLSDGVTQVGNVNYNKVSGGVLPSGTLVGTQAAAVFAPLLPTLPAVVYSVAVGSPVDGLYINATLPFSSRAVVPPDGCTVSVTGTPGAEPAPDGSTNPAPEAGAEASTDLSGTE